MPIYAYQCSQCGFRKDVLQKISDAPLAVCPECGASAFEKQLSAPSFQLKGTGWYATDFKNSGSKPASTGESAKSDSSSGSEGSSGADTQTSASPAPASAPAAPAQASSSAPSSAPAQQAAGS